MDKSIIEFLNIKAETLEYFQCDRLDNELIITIALKRIKQVCTSCNSLTDKVLSQYVRTINHGLFIDRKCTVHFRQKRYRCPVCGSSFNEKSTLVTKHQKKSIASHLQIMDLLLDPHLTFTKVGSLLHLAPSTVIETFVRDVPDFKNTLPRVLCIDEVYLGRNAIRKYVAVLMDFESGDVVDIIYGRTKDALHSYFQKIDRKERNNVQYISSDMYEGYRFLQSHYFAHAKLCLDSFHVIQLILSMYDSQLRRIMKNYDHDSIEYYLLKQKRSFLLKNDSSINWQKQEYNRKLGYHVYLLKYKQLLFEIDPLIKEIYELKELYINFNRRRSSELVAEQLDLITKRFINHSNTEVKRVGRTLFKWRKEIIDSFVWFNGKRLSNGPIESRNNTIKLIIRNAAGYHNFQHLRARILYCINQRKRDVSLIPSLHF